MQGTAAPLSAFGSLTVFSLGRLPLISGVGTTNKSILNSRVLMAYAVTAPDGVRHASPFPREAIPRGASATLATFLPLCHILSVPTTACKLARVPLAV